MSASDNQALAVISLATAAVLSFYILSPFFAYTGARPKGPVVPGLANWANWCFCNSVVQSLASLPRFRSWLERNTQDDPDDLEKLDAGSTTQLSRTLKTILRVLNVEGTAKVLSASPLIQALESLQGSRISRAQQDAQEFLHMLLESVAAEQNDMPASVSIQQMRTLAKEKGQVYKALPFEGKITTTSRCTTCEHELKRQTSPFLELTLLPPTLSRITISDLILRTLSIERIDDYNCVRCQISQLKRTGSDTTLHEKALSEDPDYDLPSNIPRSHVVLERSSVISLLPEILLLHINRSLFTANAYATRNSIDVSFPETLHLQDKAYQLRSFVTHRGSHDRGHYLSFRRKSAKWHLISDETVRIVDLETALSMGTSTFLLFYEAIDAEKKARKRRARTNEKAVDVTTESKI